MIHLFETPWRFLGKWTNSNIRCAVTDRLFFAEICQKCMFNPKKEIPSWIPWMVQHSMLHRKSRNNFIKHIEVLKQCISKSSYKYLLLRTNDTNFWYSSRRNTFGIV